MTDSATRDVGQRYVLSFFRGCALGSLFESWVLWRGFGIDLAEVWVILLLIAAVLLDVYVSALFRRARENRHGRCAD